MIPGPDGFPGLVLIWRDVLISLLDRLRRGLWVIMTGSVQLTCIEHWAGGNWEPEACRGCPYEEKCGQKERKNVQRKI